MPKDVPASGDAASEAFFRYVFPAVGLPMFIGAMDQTIVASALPNIGAALGRFDRVSWIVIAYLLAAAIAAPVYGHLGDRFGRRRLMLAALWVLMGASVLCALAPSMEWLTAARVLQGFGGGGLAALSQALIGEAVPPRDRPRFQGYLAAIIVSASTFGPIAGGLLATAFGWRSIFLINLPMAICAMLLVMRLPVRPRQHGHSSFDFLGLALFTLFIVAGMTLLQILRGPLLADAGTFVLLAGCGIAALAALFWWEGKSLHPLFPLPLLRMSAIWKCDALVACHGAVLVSLISVLPLYLRAAHGYSAADIGLFMLPLTAGVGVGAVVTGRLISRTGRTAIMPTIGLIVVTAIFAGLWVWTPGPLMLASVLGVASLFMGTVMGVAQITVAITAGPAWLGTAAGSVQLSRSLGAAFGTALVSMTFFMVIATKDPGHAGLLRDFLLAGPQAALDIAPESRATLLGALDGAMGACFAVIALFALIGAGLAARIPLKRIDMNLDP